MSADRTIVLPTLDHGPVTVTCPAWCVGHQDHDPQSERVDLMHTGPVIECTHLGRSLLSAELVQSPFATKGDRRLGGRTPGVSVWPLGLTLNPTELYSLAAVLDGYADRLRDLADQLTAVLPEGNR